MTLQVILGTCTSCSYCTSLWLTIVLDLKPVTLTNYFTVLGTSRIKFLLWCTALRSASTLLWMTGHPLEAWNIFEFSAKSPFSPFDGPLTRLTAAFNRLTTIAEAPKARSFSPSLTRSSPEALWQRWSRDTPHVGKIADSAHCKALTQHSARLELCYWCSVCPRSAQKEADPDSQVTKNDICSNQICANTVESIQAKETAQKTRHMRTGHEASSTIRSTSPMKKLVYKTSYINILIVPR